LIIDNYVLSFALINWVYSCS